MKPCHARKVSEREVHERGCAELGWVLGGQVREEAAVL
jgi:hypothetical protein